MSRRVTARSREVRVMGKWTRRAFIATGGVVGGGLVLGIGGIAFAPNRIGVRAGG